MCAPCTLYRVTLCFPYSVPRIKITRAYDGFSPGRDTRNFAAGVSRLQLGGSATPGMRHKVPRTSREPLAHH